MRPEFRKTCDAVRRQIDDFVDLSRSPEDVAVRIETVSAWSVGEQLEHLALVDRRILDGMEKLRDEPESFPRDGSPKLLGRIFLWLGVIPRGRGQAPAPSRPQGLSADQLATVWSEVERRFRDLEPLLDDLAATGRRMPHPIFGPLDFGQWLRFIQVHHHHHWKIIRDIRAAA